MSKNTNYIYAFWYVGNIGGQLGLFVGVSILTICELACYLFDKINQSLNRKPVKTDDVSAASNTMELGAAKGWWREQTCQKKLKSVTHV